MSASCVLLIVEDDLIANRIITIVGDTGCVTRFMRIDDAHNWLMADRAIKLIITDKNNAADTTRVVRSNPIHSLVPVLVTNRYGETHLLENTPTAGITDFLIINEDNDRLRAKIDFYLDLNRQTRSLDAMQPPPAPTQPFQLPVWKRIIDISVSLLILLLLSPVLLIVSLLIVLDSKGPIIYRSKRAGTNFHVFDMYKFRTMKVASDKLIGQLATQNIYSQPAQPDELVTDGMKLCSTCREQGISCQQLLFDQERPICEKIFLLEAGNSAKFMKFRNDPRITRLGTFLRNSSIDELPQFFNILLGDMSLVGNRPLPLYEAEKLTSDEFAKRFAGPAGLTGLWQVKKRAKGQGTMSDRERTLLDIEYANTFSFRTDIQIIWQTFFSLWQKEDV